MAFETKKGQFRKEEDPPEYTSKAFSLGRHPEGGFAVIIVDFNPVTMHAKVNEVKRVGDSREEAEYHFKIMVGQFFADQEGR